MSTTVHVTVKTKADSFDAMHNYAKADLAFTREFEGCHSIHASSDKATNTIKMVSVWDSKETYMAYFEKRGERSGDKFAAWLEPDGITLEFHTTDDWGYGADYTPKK